MKTASIVEGWAGGPRLSRKFATELQKKGFEVTKNVTEADYIFAHSTGCYMLPNKLRAERIMLIDPPFWPGESIIIRWMRMNKEELKFLREMQGNLHFIRDKLWEIYYIFAKPSYTWSVIKNQSNLDFIEKLKDKKILLVRNSDDEFCSPEIEKIIKNQKNISYAEVPGYHGNYYLDPKSYIDLLLPKT